MDKLTNTGKTLVKEITTIAQQLSDEKKQRLLWYCQGYIAGANDKR